LEKIIGILLIYLSSPLLGQGQSIQFKKYTDQAHKISFDIPNTWTINYNKEEDGFICTPLTKSEKDEYEDCYEGIVFRMEFYKSGLDSTLLSDGLYTKSGDDYYTSDRVNDTVRTKKMTGKNWIGIYHNNICGVSCRDTGFHGAAGQCEFFYFSDGKTTVCIDTNGREFDDKILKRLLNSFQFD
jgi:hypothetical protein